MGTVTGIQWTDHTHNFWEGCRKVDADCKFCYAERMFSRFGKDFKTVRRTKGFSNPLKWKEPAKVFTCSTSDFFIKDADEWRGEAWDIIRKSPHLTFQILTKRPERIMEHLPADWDYSKGWDNVWLGTSVGNQEGVQRLWNLVESEIQSAVRFASLEPLHGPVNLLDCPIGVPLIEFLDWVIVGGESGNEKGLYRYRPCKLEWIESIVQDCRNFEVPVFVKQLGTHLAKKLKLHDRHGGDINEWPEHLRIREFPKNKQI